MKVLLFFSIIVVLECSRLKIYKKTMGETVRSSNINQKRSKITAEMQVRKNVCTVKTCLKCLKLEVTCDISTKWIQHQTNGTSVLRFYKQFRFWGYGSDYLLHRLNNFNLKPLMNSNLYLQKQGYPYFIEKN